jgi:hypothetical protein
MDVKIMALISKKDIEEIKAVLGELATFVEEAIIYRRYVLTEQGNPVEGTPDEFIYENDPSITSATSRELTLKEVQVSGGTYILGDMEFTIRTVVAPAYADRIIYNDASWKPKEIKHFWLQEVLWWEIIAGKE